MSLKSFHIVFIIVSTALSVGLALWGFRDYQATGHAASRVLGFAGILLLVLLVPYFQWFLKKIRQMNGPKAVLVAAGLAGLSHPSVAQACAVCFGDPNSSMTKGALMGVFTLGGVISLVLAGITWTAFSWIRRARSLPRG